MDISELTSFLAVSERFRMMCHSTIAFEFVFTFICIAVTFSQCSPLEKMWDLTGTVPGVCINTTAYFYSKYQSILVIVPQTIYILIRNKATSGINIVTDIWILSLPMKTLGILNRSTKEKIALLCIFGAGTFAAIMSIVRLQSIYQFTLSTDPSRDGIAVSLFNALLEFPHE